MLREVILWEDVTILLLHEIQNHLLNPDHCCFAYFRHQINYITGAPITMTTMLSYPQRRRFTHGIKMWTAGAPPPPSVIRRFSEELGISVQTAYGLTETYGPVTTHMLDPEWTGEYAD